MKRTIKVFARIFGALAAILFVAAALPLAAEAMSHAGRANVDPFSLLVVGAVTPATMAELTDLAKSYYSDVYVPQYNPEAVLKAQFAKLENAIFTGKEWIFGMKKGVGGGASNAGANKSLPDAASGTFDQGKANVVRTYTRMALDALAIEVTKKRDGSYRPALAEIMSDRLEAHDLESNRQLWCNGDGKMALIGGTPGASATQTLQKDYGLTNGGPGTRHAYEGDTLAVYTTGGVLIGRKVVLSIDHDAGTVEFDSSITTTATTNFVTKSTADDDNYTAGEVAGLAKAISTTSPYQDITDNVWRSIVNSNSGTLRPLTDGMVMTMFAKIRARSRKTPNLIATTPGVILKYSEVFLPLRRIDGQETQLKGGYKPIKEIIHGGGNTPVIEDVDCPSSRMFFITTSSFCMADLVGTEWADLDGAQFDRVTGKDAIEGYIRRYWQLIGKQRNANGVIEDLEEVSIERRAA